MGISQRIKALENKPSLKLPPEMHSKDIPKENIIGAFKIMIEAGVISVDGYQGTVDQLAMEIYEGVAREMICKTDKNGHPDLSGLSDDQLNRMENLYEGDPH